MKSPLLGYRSAPPRLHRADSTIESYLDSFAQAEAFLRERERDFGTARREDLEAFLSHLLTIRSPGTAATRHKHLAAFYRWLEDEEEIGKSPMRRIKAPIIPEQPVPSSATTSSAPCSPPATASASRTAATSP